MTANGKRPAKPLPPSGRLPYVEAIKGRRDGEVHLYYRRGGRRIPLPQPEGSSVFLDAYHAAEGQFRRPALIDGRTVHDAITSYLGSADFRQLARASQADYRRTLSLFRMQFGTRTLSSFGEGEVAALREAYADAAIAWNALRSRMIMVVRHYRQIRPGEMVMNPWEASRRLKVEQSNAHKPWPPTVLLAVLQAATPEFRALLVGYLLTAQRGGDVTTFRPEQYDPVKQTLAVAQGKTDELLTLHVPATLARSLEAMRGRHPQRLFTTPRGRPWDMKNAQETLRTLLRQLGLDRYTLHGLRSTGPVALKLLGFENRAIRALTGHTSDKNLEVYLRGVDHYPLARAAQEALETQFSALLTEAGEQGNSRRFSGVTGKAARAAKQVPNSQADFEKT